MHKDTNECNFFISYTETDKKWAEWVAWCLENEGFSTIIQAWDFLPGENFINKMDTSVKMASKIICVMSKKYFERIYTNAEWTAYFSRKQSINDRTIIPVLIEKFDLNGLLKPIVYIDLTDIEQDMAKTRLIDGVSEKRMKPISAPPFPQKKAVRRHLTKFFHKEIGIDSCLDLSGHVFSYFDFYDPLAISDCDDKAVSINFWAPNARVIMNPTSNTITFVIICSQNLEVALERYKLTTAAAAVDVDKLDGRQINKLWYQEKKSLISGLGKAFYDCVVIALAIPESIHKIGRSSPDAVMQYVATALIMPIIEHHKLKGVEEFSILINPIGCGIEKRLIAFIKKIAKTFASDLRWNINVGSENDKLMFNVSRLIGWSVNTYYSNDNKEWVEMIEESFGA
ncbi:MAG: toll/interleukin-1 receptor domain-containing protein [Magnetococcus sp. DMHC-1]